MIETIIVSAITGVIGFWFRGYWLKKNPASLAKFLADIKAKGKKIEDQLDR